MKPKYRVLIEMAIEEGVKRGYRLAHKYNESPTEEQIIERISDTVMAQMYEYFTFDPEVYE